MARSVMAAKQIGEGAVGETRIVFVRRQAEMPELAGGSPFRIAGLEHLVAFQGRLDDAGSLVPPDGSELEFQHVGSQRVRANPDPVGIQVGRFSFVCITVNP